MSDKAVYPVNLRLSYLRNSGFGIGVAAKLGEQLYRGVVIPLLGKGGRLLILRFKRAVGGIAVVAQRKKGLLRGIVFMRGEELFRGNIVALVHLVGGILIIAQQDKLDAGLLKAALLKHFERRAVARLQNLVGGVLIIAKRGEVRDSAVKIVQGKLLVGSLIRHHRQKILRRGENTGRNDYQYRQKDEQHLHKC